MTAGMETIAGATGEYPLHRLGWKSFQDLCVSIAEECLRRPVQSFLPSNDAGRDGAFIGRWEGDSAAAGESTIQCKFTSKPEQNLTLSMLADELPKAARLAGRGLAHDYIILTNHPVTGQSDLAIRSAFEAQGVGRCRVYGSDWICRQIRTSPRLRMIAPRLYGLGDLTDLLDARAYEQAQLILSAMGSDLQRLVVTEAHRRSVRAISQHSLVLLLGAPAAGKSTIGASIAIGAADIWGSQTIRATSPDDVQRHLSAAGSQFFWIDDAWGNTQYQAQMTERWNQVFPLMQGAMRRNTRFLITSRDYIWNAARKDLKLSAMPALRQSQVIINVQELSTGEKAQMLYNHLKLGDQPATFRKAVKDLLPGLAERKDFLPETARRFGSSFFAASLKTDPQSVGAFFGKPQEFLLETVAGLSPACQAAIATVFLNGGRVRSPVSADHIQSGSSAFGAEPAQVRTELEALNGSLLLLAKDDVGAFWTYKHPTVSDAFAKHLASNPELVEMYLRGANPYSIIYEVVCAGVTIAGAPLIVPDTLIDTLVDKLASVEKAFLRTFVTYRANRVFTEAILARRPDLTSGFSGFAEPIKDDPDSQLLARLHEFELLHETDREVFVAASIADSSIFEDASLRRVLNEEELNEARQRARTHVLERIDDHVARVRAEWDKDYPPEDYFYDLERAILSIADEVNSTSDAPLFGLSQAIQKAVSAMEEQYEPSSSTSAPVSSSTPQASGLAALFRDVDE
jgi:hypothetical protein